MAEGLYGHHNERFAVNDINNIEEDFKDLLTKYKKELQIPLNFFGAAKNVDL